MAISTNSTITGIVDITSTAAANINQNAARLPFMPSMLKNSSVDVSCASTGVDENLFTVLIPAGTLNNGSIIQIEPYWTYTNSANNKILFVKTSGGVDLFRRTRTTTAEEAPLIVYANKNVLNSQQSIYARATTGAATYFSGGTTTAATTAIDFSGDITLIVGGQRANAGDTLTLNYVRIWHFPGT